jgi:hypothetical protein
MIVFSSLEAARREGFQPFDFDREQNLFVVQADMRRSSYRVKMLALARNPLTTALPRCERV